VCCLYPTISTANFGFGCQGVIPDLGQLATRFVALLVARPRWHDDVIDLRAQTKGLGYLRPVTMSFKFSILHNNGGASETAGSDQLGPGQGKGMSARYGKLVRYVPT
jgi:hypothetical protein